MREVVVSLQDSNPDLAPSNSTFLQHLLAAAPKGSSVWVNAFIGNPNGAEASWGGKAYNAAMMARKVRSI